MRKPITISIDSELWKKFQIACIEDGTVASYVIENLMQKMLENRNQQATASAKL